MSLPRSDLYDRIRQLIERLAGGQRDDAARDALLLELADYQREHVAPYARFAAQRLQARGVTQVSELSQVPALPTDAFRFARISSRPESEDLRTFRSSGTTNDERSIHVLQDLSLYDVAAESAARHALFPDRERMPLIILAPHERELGDSSLSYMLARFVEWFGNDASTHVWPLDAPELERLRARLHAAEQADMPVALLGTSFAFVHALDALGEQRFKLAAGSRIMQTGGFKGRTREIAPGPMRQLLVDTFGVADRSIVAEYGMTELSSQLYENTLRAELSRESIPERRLWAPGWLRTSIVDPETLAALPDGEEGLLRIDDLANLDSVAFIQTSDLAVADEAGIRLLGRAPLAWLAAAPSPRTTCSADGRDEARVVSEPRQDASEALRLLASELSRSAAVLHQAGGERRARWLADAFAHLSRPDSELGREARAVLVQGSGLSEPMVEWALESALAPLTFEVLRALEQSPRPPHPDAVRTSPGQLCVVVLAGNVVTGAARAIGWPLLFGWPVLAKASSGDDTMARLLEAALAEGDPELAGAYRVVTYAAGQDSLNAALFEQADAVSVYGSDDTVNTIRAELGATVSFMAHGNGLGVAVIGRPALATREQAQLVARALALDVAAYDQRGCLSPHTAWVQHGGLVSPEAFAELVHAELALLRDNLPRGRLPRDSATAQLSWRGVGAVRGSLFEGDGFAVSFEQTGALRVSPGYRNLQVLALDSLRELSPRLAPLGVHLKCIGYAGIEPAELLAVLPTRLAPRLCPVGQMQRPPVNALHDGIAAWEGLLRWADCSTE